MDLNRIKKSIIEDSNGCWVWQRSCNSAGYGQLTENGKYWTAHRYAYSCFKEIPEGYIIRHLCHNTKCCNPAHLTIGTNRDNWFDSEYNHRKGSSKRRLKWLINGEEYPTIRKASKITGISQHALVKYTDSTTRIFDVKEYRKGCKKARVIPKI